MKVRLALTFALALSGLLIITLTAMARENQSLVLHQPPNADFVVGEVLVKLRPGTTLSATPRSSLRSNSTALSERLSQVAARTATTVFAGTRIADLQRIYRLQIDPNQDVMTVIKILEADPNVEYAEPNFLARAAVAPNDPLYSSQWALAKINAPAAWDVVTGTPSVVIALIDSGIDTTHPDLTGRLWVNPGEIPGNGLDDDNNGFVDDMNGWNFVGNNNNVSDDNGHGTQVAGVAGASTNNAIGISGMCWNCGLMIVKAMQASGVANYSDIAAAVNYAATKGAQVINLSLGGYADSATLRAAIDAASTSAVIVGGAGNDNVSTPFYPAAYPNALSVASTTISDTKAAFSNYGSWINLAAPGVAISTTFSGGDYGTSEGTSLSAPLVAGLAGLIKSAHPDWSPALVRAQIVHTTDAITDTTLGSGRIDAASALTTLPMPNLQFVNYAANNQTNGLLKTGAVISLTTALYNDWLDVSIVTATLSTTSTDVIVTKADASFGAVAAGQTVANSGDVFRVSVASGAYGRAVPFTLILNVDGGISTLVFTATTESVVASVGGAISSDTVWTNDRIYQATGNIVVNAGVTLTIQPGTKIKFNPGMALLINGTLIADGTAASPILFTSAAATPVPGDWGGTSGCATGGIIFSANSQPAQFDLAGNYLGGSIIRHSIVEYSQGIGSGGGGPFIDHNLIWENSSSAIMHNGCGFPIRPVISHNQLVSNAGAAISILTGAADVRQNLITSNGAGIYLSGGRGSIISNTIVDNGGMICSSVRGVICGLGTGGTFPLEGNNILGNRAPYDMVMGGSASQVFPATDNYWGTTDQAAIRTRIYDAFQDLNLGTINFAPFLAKPEPLAPAFLSSLAISPVNPIGIQQATFTLTFSAPIEQSSDPLVKFYSSKRGTSTLYNSSNSGLPSNSVLSLATDAKGNKWIGTDLGGLARFDGTTWTTYDTNNSGLPQNSISAIAIDSTGNTWLGTPGGSVVRYDGSAWKVYSSANSSLPGQGIWAIAIDASGNKWFGTYGGGVVRFDGTTWTVYNTHNTGLASDTVLAITIDNAGIKWFGTFGGGVTRFDGTTWTTYNTSNSPLPDNHIAAIATDLSNNKWIGLSGNGVARFDGTNWTIYNTTNSGLPNNSVTGVAIDKDGASWFGDSTGGVTRFNGTTWTVFDYGPSMISSITIDSNRNKWIGTGSDGIKVRWDGQDFLLTDNAQWLTDRVWRATYDITSLIPRDTYTVSVTGVNGIDGIPIPTDTRFGFTVDYAGGVVDTTPPPAPSLSVDICRNSTTSVTASWFASDPNSAITLYRYALGSSTNSVDVLNWTDTGSTAVTRTGLNLVAGQRYYFSVTARNAGGLWSEATSRSFTAGIPCQRVHLPLVRK